MMTISQFLHVAPSDVAVLHLGRSMKVLVCPASLSDSFQRDLLRVPPQTAVDFFLDRSGLFRNHCQAGKKNDIH